MEIITAPLAFQARCRELAAAGLGFVPTMGALHDGHLSLVRASRARDARTAVSIFVNPTQFGPREDFGRYPRPLDRDLELLRQAGVAVAFTPAAEAMYPEGDDTRVELARLGARLDGASRPGHFRGVATVVLKLLALAQPARAYFGQKDAAQVAVLRRMARDLFLPVEIVVGPIVRDADGLALSSRNAYLAPAERRAALAIPRALAAMSAAFAAGIASPAALLETGRAIIAAEPGLKLDYLVVVDAETLLPLTEAASGALVAVAAFAGPTRLIDNLLL